MKAAKGTFIVLAGLVGLLQVGCSEGPQIVLTETQQVELETLREQLSAPARSAETKTDAAVLLLTREYPQASQVLVEFLSAGENRAAQIAIAAAIIRHGSGGEDLIDPLLVLLTGDEPSVRAPAVRALGTYDDHGVTGKLASIARDRSRSSAVRLVVIGALQSSLSKEAVDTLVLLLDDKNEDIRQGALNSLVKVTNIHTFGGDPVAWKRWWALNRFKPAWRWKGDLAEGLAKARAAAADENIRLRSRIAQAMEDLYDASPVDQKEKMLSSFLRDDLGDVRVVGLRLVERRTTAGGKVSKETIAQVRSLLSDKDERVRRAAALGVAHLGDTGALGEILSRMEIENALPVRRALLTALGRLDQGEGIDAVLEELQSPHDSIAAAAAQALVRIVGKSPLQGKQHAGATEILVARYTQAEASTNGHVLREALLAAMGGVGDKDFVGVMEKALTDSAATVRLAAIDALARLKAASSAGALTPLVADPDRGVRQAALAALGVIGTKQHIKAVLSRTGPPESNEAVRTQAWSALFNMLERDGSSTVIEEVSNSLADRDNAVDQRVGVMGMLVDALRREKSDKLPGALRGLAGQLIELSRPDEAAKSLGEAYDLLNAAGSEEAMEVWGQWVDALLTGGDTSVVEVMAAQSSDDAFTRAVQRTVPHLREAYQRKEFATVILLGGEIIEGLSERLSDSQRQVFQKILSDSRAGQLRADRGRVANLTRQLLAGDESSRKAAEAKLAGLADRAVEPLLDELEKAIGGVPPANEEAEQAILGILRQIAPALTGYDAKAELAEKVKVIHSWRESLGKG